MIGHTNKETAHSTLGGSMRSNEDYWATLKQISALNLSTGSDECLNERSQVALTQPDVVKEFLCPISEPLQKAIVKFRDDVSAVIDSEKRTRLLVVVGPEKLDNFIQSRACSRWLNKRSQNATEYSILTPLNSKELHDKVKKIYNTKNPLQNLQIAMNVDLSGAYESGKSYMSRAVFNGVVNLRLLLIGLTEQIQLSGVIDDPISLQYYNDLLGLASLKSENIESQVHREFISGVPFPVGFNCFKSSLQGSCAQEIQEHKIQKAVDAINAVGDPHYFLSVTNLGNIAIASTLGNKDTFLLISIQQDKVITLEKLKRLVDAPLNQLNNVTIMLDVGLLSIQNYDKIWNLLVETLKSDIGNYIFGILLDSGKQYVPLSWEDGDSNTRNENHNENKADDEDFVVLSESIGVRRHSMKGKFFNTFKSSYGKITSVFENKQHSTKVSEYEHLILADKFISQLNDLMK